MKRTFPTRSTFALLSLVACGLPDRSLGELATETESGSSSVGETTAGATSPSDPSVTGPQGGTGGSETGEPVTCEDLTEPPKCSEDVDGDNVRYACDNAPDAFNPSQMDTDEDGIGDAVDLCPTVAGTQNTSDSDDDGIGNACDSCPYTMGHYNELAGIGIPGKALIRNIPDVGDADGDGIGDACDNCVVVPNCEDYATATPWAPGDPIQRDDPNTCQRDDDGDMIGDACAGAQIVGAAGPVGFGEDDDFDQDGLANAIDGCFRLPLPAAISCTSDDECGAGTACEIDAGLCNHVDLDDDLVGDICDTCAVSPNEAQLEEGGMQEDDDDGDFVGGACETELCEIRTDPAPMAFFTLAAAGRCCTTLLVEEEGGLFVGPQGLPLLDPDGLPVRIDCVVPDDPDLRTCSRLPEAVAQAPGVLTLPPGCASAGQPVDPGTLDGDLDEYWTYRCELPQWDQDFDGIGDAGDFCPFAFDPENVPYTDDQGVVWPNDGKYCNGDYNIDAICGE